MDQEGKSARFAAPSPVPTPQAEFHLFTRLPTELQLITILWVLIIWDDSSKVETWQRILSTAKSRHTDLIPMYRHYSAHHFRRMTSFGGAAREGLIIQPGDAMGSSWMLNMPVFSLSHAVEECGSRRIDCLIRPPAPLAR